VTQHPGHETQAPPADIARYAQAVRDALADHPDREELLEDLDDHLAEIAAESDAPLEERLGPPAAYAEELVAAYGGRPASGQKPRLRLRVRLVEAYDRLAGNAAYRSFTGFLPELRPGWWVLRGYLLAMLLLSVIEDDRLLPGNPVEVVLVVAAIVASVWFGRRAGGTAWRGLAVLANGAAAVALLAGVVVAGQLANAHDRLFDMERSPQSVYLETVSGLSGEVYNIKPYSKDGTPLTDVHLYDQSGRPLITDPESYGYEVDRTCGEPILNRYPLPLVPQEGTEAGTATPPTPCPAPSPAASASVSIETATPESPAPSPALSEPATTMTATPEGPAPSPSRKPTG
jgi:hypothetical protein